MRAVSEEGSWEPWLLFFVDGIRQQAADAVTRTDELLDVSHQTARTAITTLEDGTVLQEKTGKERYQEFRSVDIFDILTRSFEGSD